MVTVSPTVIEGGALDRAKPIALSVHAREKMLDRGATEGEVMTAIRTDSPEPAASNGSCFARISH